MSIAVSVNETETNVSTVESTAVLDTALEDVLVETTEAPVEVGVSPYIVVNSGVVGGGGTFTLASATSPGASTITLDRTPPLGFASRASVLCIDPGSVNCETRLMSSVTGNVVTLNFALSNAHASGAQVIWVLGDIPISFYGAVCDNATDDWAAIQTAINDVQKYAVGNYLNWFNQSSRVSKPLVGTQGTSLRRVGGLRPVVASYTPAEATNALLMSCNGPWLTFTALASNDTFTTPDVHSMSVGNRVSFSGAALPAPLVTGRVYYVKTVPTTTTFTVSTTDGGATLNLTTDGSGIEYAQTATIERLYLDDVLISGSSLAGVNGLLAGGQQPGFWNKLKVQFCPGVGVHWLGQQYNTYGMEITSCGTGLVLDSGATLFYNYGTNIETCTVEGILLDAGSLGGGVQGVSDSLFSGLHMENCPIFIHMKHGANITYDQVHMSFATGQVGIQVEAGNLTATSYQVRGLHGYGGSVSDKLIHDLDRGYDVLISDASNGRLMDFVQDLGEAGGAPNVRGPRLPGRTVVRNKTTTYTASIADDLIKADATGGAFTVTLPTAVNIAGKQYTVKRTNSGANAVTVGTTSSQTIDGATTYALSSQYASLTVQSDGANWMIVPLASGGGGGGSVAADTIWDAKGDLAIGTGADTASKLTVGSNDQVLTADSTQATGAKWATGVPSSGAALGAPYYITNDWYAACPSQWRQGGTGQLVNERVVYIPFPIGTTHTFTGVGIEVTASGEAGSVLRFGVYNDNGAGAPGTLIADFGTVAVASSTGAKNITGLSQSLARGWVWVAFAGQAAASDPPSVRFAGAGEGYGAGVGAADTNGSQRAYTETGISGALPGTATPTKSAVGLPSVGLKG